VLAGGTSYRGDFVADLVHRLLFFDLQPRVFTLGDVRFGLAVPTTLVLAPPRWTEHGQSSSQRSSVPDWHWRAR
jgi:hypothetical protein